MIRCLEKMPPGQPVAIYALSSKLTLLQDFTSDPEVLKDAMKKLKNHVSELLDNPGGGAPDEVLPPGVADSGMIPAQTLDALMRFEADFVSDGFTRQRYTVCAHCDFPVAVRVSGPQEPDLGFRSFPHHHRPQAGIDRRRFCRHKELRPGDRGGSGCAHGCTDRHLSDRCSRAGGVFRLSSF